MNQLEKLGLIMVKIIEDSIDGNTFLDIDLGVIDGHPSLTNEQWSEIQAVVDDLSDSK